MPGNPSRAWVFGDDVDTDALSPGIYMRAPLEELAKHCLETRDPEFAGSVRPGDVVVGGRNFGMGSSREQAAEVLCHLGVKAVLAISFAGIFYRNAFNLGLPAVVCTDAGRIGAGDEVELDLEAGSVSNLTTREDLRCEPVPGHLAGLVAAGGLIPLLQRRLREDAG